MKVAVESSVLARVNKTGVDFYTRDLMREVIKIMPNDQFVLCYLKFLGRPEGDLEVTGKNVTVRRVKLLPGKVYNAFERYFITIPFDWVTRVRADVYFYPNFIYWPLTFTKKSIIVVHDLGFIDRPEAIIARFRKYLIKFIPYSINRATHVVAISEHTKKRIIEVYGTDPNKISVVTPAVDHDTFKPQAQAAIDHAKKRYKIEGDYLLFLGTIEPRKNITGLLEAYSRLPNDLRNNCKVVLAGGKGWLDEEINNWCDKLGDRVIRTGYIDQADKPALYAGASIFTYPSSYEGWGMQPLEAMACGAPVITADNSSLPEAVGKAGLIVKTGDTERLTHAIEKVLTDKKLRSKMIADGYKQAASFSWQKSAKLLKKVLEDTVKNS